MLGLSVEMGRRRGGIDENLGGGTDELMGSREERRN